MKLTKVKLRTHHSDVTGMRRLHQLCRLIQHASQLHKQVPSRSIQLLNQQLDRSAWNLLMQLTSMLNKSTKLMKEQ